MNKAKYKKISIILGSIFLIFSLILLVIYKSMSLDQYPKLDSCLKASVSKNILCTQNKSYVKLKNISEDVTQAIITSEDDKFYFHEGFDWKEFRASVQANLRAFSFVRGGSTITQQLVKNIYLSQEKSIIRKIKEAALAAQIEEKYSKPLILEKYLNAIEFGPDVWGIRSASKYYFSKEPKDLEVLEGAYLAVLLPSPKRYSSSFRNKKLTPYLKRRIKTILHRLKIKKYLDEVDYSIALDNIDFFPWDKKPIMDIELYDFESDEPSEANRYDELVEAIGEADENLESVDAKEEPEPEEIEKEKQEPDLSDQSSQDDKNVELEVEEPKNPVD